MAVIINDRANPAPTTINTAGTGNSLRVQLVKEGEAEGNSTGGGKAGELERALKAVKDLEAELEQQRRGWGTCQKLLLGLQEEKEKAEKGKGKEVRWEVDPPTLLPEEVSRGGTVWLQCQTVGRPLGGVPVVGGG